ncbi:MAG: hypothetical protein ACRDHS_11305 [Actinomycetota bacterium]
MVVLNVLAFVAGATLVLFTLRSAVRVFLVPRALQAYLARAVFVLVRRVFWLRANQRHEYRRRDAVMAFYAPVALLTLLALWLTMVLAGYTAMYWGLGNYPFRRSFGESGSALFTLGFERPHDLPTEVLMFTEAAVGLGFLALFISYLPSLYGAFSRRETGVAKLEVRAGRPPSGVYLIQLAWRVGRLESLKGLWKDWEEWFVSVDESHSSFPALAFFRSTHADESWVTAAGAILDGASLYVSSVDVPRTPEAEFMIRAGYLCLRHIAQFFWIAVPDDPAPTDPISIERDEFDAAYDRLARAGVAMKPDRDQAWRDFAGWRVNYDAALIGLARLTMAPPAPWSSDRYADRHYLPPAFPWQARPRRAASPDRAPSSDGASPDAEPPS